MRFLMTPVGSSGDVHPYIGIGRMLRDRGHDVAIMTAAPFETMVVRAGLTFYPTISAEEYDRVTRNPNLWHRREGLRIVMSEVGKWIGVAYKLLAATYRPGTVLVGHGLSFATRLYEEKYQVPAATLHLAPSIFRSDHAQPAFSPGRDLSNWPRWFKRALWWTIDRFLIDPMVVPSVNEFRRELRLPPVHRVMRDWVHSPRLVVGLFPDWFAPRQPDWPASLQLTGFPLYDESDRPQAIAPGLERFLRHGTPPIVFTPGSANQVAETFFREAVAACERLKRRALLLTRYESQLPPLPDGVHHERYVPLSAVLPRCAAIVHHGGIGTLAQGLAAGIPQVTMPMGFDQPDNATRLARLGVGRWVMPEEFTRDTVAATLHELLGNPKVTDACAQWAVKLRDEHAVARTCELLERIA